MEEVLRFYFLSFDQKSFRQIFLIPSDHIFEEILYSTDDKLNDARKELEDVVMRRLPKCVGETRLTETEQKEEKAFKAQGSRFKVCLFVT